MFKRMGLFVLGLLLMAGEALAQVFPVDAATSTTITSVKGGIVAWGVVFIGGALTIFAYKRVKSLVRESGRWGGSLCTGCRLSWWEGWPMVLATVATDLQQLGRAPSADVIGWGAAVLGIALTASAVIWVLRLIRA